MKAINRFKELDLFNTLFAIVQGYMSKQEFNKILSEPSRYEQYNIDVLLSANNIIECLDQIHYTIEMLSGFKTKRGSLMNRHDYIVFILENFYLRITSIFDRTLRFLNIVFEIGLPEKECKESTIIQNDKIKYTPMYVELKKLNALIHQYRFPRNKIAHSEAYNEKRLEDIQQFYIVIESGSDKSLERYKYFYKRIADEYVVEKRNELNKITEEIEKLLVNFFNGITPYVKINGLKYE